MDDHDRIRSLFEGLVNRTIPVIQIKHGGRLYSVTTATTPEELTQARELHDLAFEANPGIGIEELTHISRRGKVLVLRDDAGQLMAELWILLYPIPEYPNIADDEAYCCGIAVRPNEEDKDYAQILIKAQEVVAREAGKKRISLVERVENAQRIRAWLHAGFRITGYNKAKYTAFEVGGVRLIMEKDLLEEPLPFDPIGQRERVRVGQIPMWPNSGEEPLEIAISVLAGDWIGDTAHLLIAQALQIGYIGTGLLQAEEYQADSGRNLFIFHKKDELPAVEALASSVHVTSEYGPLKEVVVAYPPEAALIQPENVINLVAGVNVWNVDPIAFKDEYQAFIEALVACGVEVRRTNVRPTRGNPAIFTRDPATVIGERFVICKLARDQRIYETAGMRRISVGQRVEDLEQARGGAIVEGGDLVFIGDKRIAVGLGERTNEAGLVKLRQAFPDYEFVSVVHDDLHLDVLFTMVGEKKALADSNPSRPQSFIEFLNGLRADGYTIIEADPIEQRTLGCNVLAIDNNTVIAVAENKETNRRLREAGVQVIEVSMPNIIKRGGGPRCMTCPTYRE